MLKKIFKKLIPPFLLNLRNLRNKTVYSGDYASWSDALKLCSGYNQDSILSKVSEATKKVVSGEAAFERDSVLFYKEEYNWNIIECLTKIAAQNNNQLCVLDFGGALGSTYFQNRKKLTNIDKLEWCIVEQEKFVELGNKEFKTKELCFLRDIKEVTACRCNVILLSSVLPYLENPYTILKELLELNVDTIIIDRTPVIAGEQDRLTMQKVPPCIYQASYPAWFLSDKKLLRQITAKYTLIDSFEALGGKIILKKPFALAMTKGYIFKIKEADEK